MKKKQILTYSVLGLLVVLAAVWFWASWARLIETPFDLMFGSREIIRPGVLFFVAFTCFFALIGLLLALSAPWSFLLPTFVLSAISYFIFVKLQPILLIVPLIFFLSLLYFSWVVRKDLVNHIKFSASHTFRPTFHMLLTFLAISLAVHSYFAVYGKLDQFKLEIPDFIFEKVGSIVGGIMGDFGEGEVRGDETNQSYFGFEEIPPEVEEILKRGEITSEMREMIKLQLPGVPEEMIDSVIDELIQKYQQENQGGGFNSSLTAEEKEGGFDESIVEGIKKMIEPRLNQAIVIVRPYLPAVFAVTIFFLIRYFGILLIPTSVVVLEILLSLLMGLKVVQKRTEKVDAERIVVE